MLIHVYIHIYVHLYTASVVLCWGSFKLLLRVGGPDPELVVEDLHEALELLSGPHKRGVSKPTVYYFPRFPS